MPGRFFPVEEFRRLFLERKPEVHENFHSAWMKYTEKGDHGRRFLLIRDQDLKEVINFQPCRSVLTAITLISDGDETEANAFEYGIAPLKSILENNGVLFWLYIF